MSSPFKPLYGEPDWTHRPYETSRPRESGYVLIMSDFKNASYEENRLRAMNIPGALDADLSRISALSISEWGSIQQRPHGFNSATTQRTFLQWCQTPHIEILAGEEESSFRLPGDLITRRSRVLFKAVMEAEPEENKIRTFQLPETSTDTFEHVFVWLMSPSPSIDNGLPTSVILDMAIFATIYELPSLLHQTIDALWDHFTSSKSFWNPNLLGRIYRNTTVYDLLREFARASLPYINRPNDHLFKSTFPVEEWQDLFERNPDPKNPGLGFDYFVMTQRGWTTQDLVAKGSCSFHKHILEGSEISGMNSSLCRQTQEAECFSDVATLLIEGAMHEPGEAQESSNASESRVDSDGNVVVAKSSTPKPSEMKGTPELSESHLNSHRELVVLGSSSPEPSKANEPPDSMRSDTDSHGEVAVLKSITSEPAKTSDSDFLDKGLSHGRKIKVPVPRPRPPKPSVTNVNSNGKRRYSGPQINRLESP